MSRKVKIEKKKKRKGKVKIEPSKLQYLAEGPSSRLQFQLRSRDPESGEEPRPLF